MNAPRRWQRVLRSRPRLWGALLVGLAVYAALQAAELAAPTARALLAFNACVATYLLAAVHMALGATPARLERRGVRQDDGRWLALGLVALAAVAVPLAVFAHLEAGAARPAAEAGRGLALLSLAAAWLFTQTFFAVQYAHDFYLSRAIGRDDVLVFPGTREPGYGDFLYLACVIGASCQTAHVAFHGRTLRPVATVQVLLAYVQHAALLALLLRLALR